MAEWKKVVVSGSNITQLNNDANYIAQDDTGVSLSGSFSGSFFGDGSGLSGVAASFPVTEKTPIAGDTQIFVNDGASKYATVASFNSASWTPVSGDATITDAGVLTVANDAIDDDKLANMTRGTIKVGKISNAPGNLNAKNDGYILIGDGTDVNSVAVSGDVTIDNTGATTIGANAVEGSMLNTNVADGTTIEVSSNTLSTLKVPNALTAGSGLASNGTFDGAAARRFTVDSGSLVAYYSGSTFAQVSGDVTISSTGTATIGSDAVALGSNTTGNYVATIANATNGGVTVSNSGTETAAVTLALNAFDLVNVAPDNQNDKIVIVDDDDNGTKTADISSIISNAAGTNLSADAGGALNLDSTLTGDITFSGDTITVNNDLIVQGTASFQNTTNLEVADQFILLNSGSSTDNSPGGIVIQQNTQDEGVAFAYDAAADSNNGRWGTTDAVNASGTTFTADAYVSYVLDIDAGQSDVAKYQQNGNIKVDSGDIFIYA